MEDRAVLARPAQLTTSRPRGLTQEDYRCCGNGLGLPTQPRPDRGPDPLASSRPTRYTRSQGTAEQEQVHALEVVAGAASRPQALSWKS